MLSVVCTETAALLGSAILKPDHGASVSGLSSADLMASARFVWNSASAPFLIGTRRKNFWPVLGSVIICAPSPHTHTLRFKNAAVTHACGTENAFCQHTVESADSAEPSKVQSSELGSP